MAQPSVAREPSMDEILASIRKIIENNETPETMDAGRSAPSFHIAANEDRDPLDDPSIVEEFHAEEGRAAADPVTLPRADAAQPALSLADVAARVRAASERHGGLDRDADPVSVAVLPREESPVVTARMAASARPAVQAEPRTETPEPVAEPAAEPEAVQTLPAARDVAALVSPAVGERVAQSFGALAEAVDAGPRRSFDEIAEEMLRPMLQDWLDDNLPTLVERLVREEIERVARGPRR